MITRRQTKSTLYGRRWSLNMDIWTRETLYHGCNEHIQNNHKLFPSISPGQTNQPRTPAWQTGMVTVWPLWQLVKSWSGLLTIVYSIPNKFFLFFYLLDFSIKPSPERKISISGVCLYCNDASLFFPNTSSKRLSSQRKLGSTLSRGYVIYRRSKKYRPKHAI